MKTVKRIVSLCMWGCLLLAGAVAAQGKDAGEPPALIVLYVGEIRTLPVAGVQRVAVGNGRLITPNVLEKEVLLLAESAGDTGLYIWQKDGSVRKYNVRVTQS